MSGTPSRLLRDIQSQADSLDVVLTYQRGGRDRWSRRRVC